MNFKSNRTSRHMIDILFTLALFCVFAAASLLVVLIGANVYRSTIQKMDANFEINTSLNYASTKIRQYDTAGSVYIATIEGKDALILEEAVAGAVYQTWIYHYNGALHELYINKENSSNIQLDAGQELMLVHDFSMEIIDGDLLRLTASNADGISTQRLIGTRSSEKRWAR